MLIINIFKYESFLNNVIHTKYIEYEYIILLYKLIYIIKYSIFYSITYDYI
jgi:hypothetical protein